MNNWKHKDIWTKRSTNANFRIEISRHSEEPLFPNEGTNRWCVYAYIYPSHPHFDKFKGDDLFQPAAVYMPLHCGASLLRYHRNESGAITSVQVGADYHHLHDAEYTRYKTAEDASSVFGDAEELHDWLAVREAK